MNTDANLGPKVSRIAPAKTCQASVASLNHKLQDESDSIRSEDLDKIYL